MALIRRKDNQTSSLGHERALIDIDLTLYKSDLLESSQNDLRHRASDPMALLPGKLIRHNLQHR
jgi:hypothetical protein